MADRIRFELVTPTAKLVDKEVDEVRIPGGGGGFGVRAGHAGLLSTLGAGTLTLVDDGKAERYVVVNGFVEAGPASVVVLAAEALAEGEVDVAEAKREIDSALDQHGNLLGVGRNQIVKCYRPIAGIVHVGRERSRAAGRSNRAGNETRMLPVDTTTRVGRLTSASARRQIDGPNLIL